MAKTLQQIQKQIEQLQKDADRLRKKEAGEVASRIKEAIAVYGFTAADLGLEGKRGRPARATASGPAAKSAKSVKASSARPPKYKDQSGNVWGGRGPKPGWFKAAIAAGKTPEELLA